MKEYIRKHRILILKKLIAVGLILFGLIFVISNRDMYYSRHRAKEKIESEEQGTESLIEFSGNKTFEQSFFSRTGRLDEITVRFFNQGGSQASGTVSLSVLAKDGQVLQNTEKPVQQLNASLRTTFSFEDPVTLKEGEEYILQVNIRDAYNPQGFGIYTHTLKGDLYGDLLEDGRPVDGRLRCTFVYTTYNTHALISMLLLLILSLIFVFIPFGRIDYLLKKKLKKTVDTNRLVSRVLFLTTPVLCVFLGDRFNGYHLYEMIQRIFSLKFLLNLLIYVIICLIVYTVINRTQYTAVIVLGIAAFADIANYYVWIFRGCPILAADVQSLATAMNVANNFSYSLDFTGIWGLVYIISFVSVLISLKGYRGLPLKKRLIPAAAGAASVFLAYSLFFNSDFVATHVYSSVWKPENTYAKNGNALSFVMSWSSARIRKPDGYSVKKVKELTEKYVSDTVSGNDAAENNSPNIIAIMDEALADLNFNNTLDLSEDYLPFIHSLKENTVKGQLFVSIEGANTANTEFEFLTGDSINFLPYRIIAYNECIKDVTPSMAHSMKAQGYAGVNAYHPFLSSGWSRTIAYPFLGFNNCYFQEYYQQNDNDDLVRIYISDKSDFKQIIQDFETSKKESSTPFYLFNVTMQNHGSYGGKRGVVDTKIKIQDSALYNFEAEQYFNLAKMTDDAFKMLVNYFKKSDEPTIIVIFGDHQPPIDNEFYSTQFGTDVLNLSAEQKANWYSTPYIIWANYDIAEEELDMSANYLSSYVMNLAGLKLTGYNKYLLDLQKKLPVISAVCYKDKNGKTYFNDEESEYTPLLEEYSMIQYNQLFDKKNRLDDFFFLKE